MKKAAVPHRLAVFHALCSLSPETYAGLARLILLFARDEALARSELARQVRPLLNEDRG